MSVDLEMNDKNGATSHDQVEFNNKDVPDNRQRQEIKEKFIQWIKEGYQCSQILLMQFLELQGKTNWDVVRMVDGLQGGLGYAGKNCGVLTAAVCALGLYVGRGPSDEAPHEDVVPIVLQLEDWFEEKYGSRFGGIDCANITEMSFDDEMPLGDVCTDIIVDTYFKAISLLKDYDFDLEVGRG